MSEEDQLEEVYDNLTISRSELESQVMREVYLLKEEAAKQKAQKEMRKILAEDLEMARRWTFALTHHRAAKNFAQKEGRQENKDWEFPTPDGSSDDPEQQLREYSAILEAYPDSWDDRLRFEHASGLNGDVLEGLIKRTARRLETDSFRLINLLAYVQGGDCLIQTTDVNWIMPYLEGHLKLARGYYKDEANDRLNFVGHDLDFLANQHNLNQQEVNLANMMSPRQPVGFNVSSDPGIEDTSISLTAENNFDHLPSQFMISSAPISPKTEQFPADTEMKDISNTDQVDDNMFCQGQAIQMKPTAMLNPGAISEIKQLVQELFDRRAKDKVLCDKALKAGAKMLEYNTVLEKRLAEVSSQLQRELERRNEVQGEVGLKKSPDAEVHEHIVAAIFKNHKADAAFRLKRIELMKQLNEEQFWLTQARRNGASEMEGSVQILMENIRRVGEEIDALQSDREQVWVQFVGCLDGLSEEEIEEWKGLRRAKTRLLGPMFTPKSYCDKDHYHEFSGDDKDEYRP